MIKLPSNSAFTPNKLMNRKCSTFVLHAIWQLAAQIMLYMTTYMAKPSHCDK